MPPGRCTSSTNPGPPDPLPPPVFATIALCAVGGGRKNGRWSARLLLHHHRTEDVVHETGAHSTGGRHRSQARGMTIFIEAEWRSPLLFSREQIAATDKAVLLARTRRGELVRLFPGIYTESNLWMSLDQDAQYRLRIEAVALAIDRDIVVSHESAACLWRLPRVDAWPTGFTFWRGKGAQDGSIPSSSGIRSACRDTCCDSTVSGLRIWRVPRWMSQRRTLLWKASPRSMLR